MRVSWVELIVGLFCLGLFVYLPGRRAEDYRAQARTTEFVPLDATVTRSDVSSYRTRRGGTRYSWFITYSIDTPAGPVFSDRQAFTGAASRSKSSAEDLVDEHPVGSVITVYAHPDDVSITVLRRGLSFGELFHAGISATLLFTGICFCVSGLGPLFSRPKSTIAGGAHTSITLSKATLATETESPLSWAATFFGIAVAPAVPISGLLGGRGLYGTLAVGGVLLILLLVISYRIYLARLRARWSDRNVLVFEYDGARVILPKRSYAAKDPVPAKRVSGFEITEYKAPKSGTRYQVFILYRDRGDSERQHIRTLPNREQAQSLVDWCEEQLARCRGNHATAPNAPRVTPQP